MEVMQVAQKKRKKAVAVVRQKNGVTAGRQK
jgi:hypothetical protein